MTDFRGAKPERSRLPLPWRCLAETVSLELAVGRILRAPIVAALDIPHYASAAMDGWAVAGPGPWRLATADALRPGDATPIVTGGLLPPGADAVVRSENAAVADGILTIGSPESRSHIRPPARGSTRR